MERKVSIKELYELEINVLLCLRTTWGGVVGSESIAEDINVANDDVLTYILLSLSDKGYCNILNGISITLDGLEFIHKKKLLKLWSYDLALLDLFDNNTEKTLTYREILRIAEERFFLGNVKDEWKRHSLKLLVRVNYLRVTKTRKRTLYSITKLGIQALKNQEKDLDYSSDPLLPKKTALFKSGTYRITE